MLRANRRQASPSSEAGRVGWAVSAVRQRVTKVVPSRWVGSTNSGVTDPSPRQLREQNDEVLQALSHWRHRAFGFYDWYLQPNVRQDQLARGVDGGIIAFYYQYYLAGIGQGNTNLYYVRGR